MVEAKNLIKVLGDPDDDRPGEIKRMRRYSARVRELPDETRALLAIAVRRGYENAVRNKDEGGLGSMTVNPTEVQKAARLSNSEYREQIRILAEHGLANVEDGEESGRWTMYIAGQGSWHRIPEDIARTCKEHNIALEDVYVHLRFDLLDGVAKDE